MAGDQDHPEVRQDADDAFDRRVWEILEQEEGLLDEQSDLLIATGSIAVQRPTGELTARLQRPAWWRRGELEINSDSGSARISLSRAAYRDHAGLRREISLQLAVHFASLEED